MKSKGRNENPYRKYGLSRNPFPSIPIASIWSKSPFFKEIFKNEISYLKKMITKSQTHNPQITYILGERGCGKSALLNFFLKECRRKTDIVTPIFMKFGFNSSFAPLYRSAVWWMGKDFIHKICTKSSRQTLSEYLSAFHWNPSQAYMNLVLLADNVKFPVIVEILNLIAERSKILIGIDGFDNVFPFLSNNQRIDLFYGFSRLIDGVDGDLTLFFVFRQNIMRWIQDYRVDLEFLGVQTELIEPHVLFLKKLTLENAFTLVSNFIKKYRISDYFEDELFPFTSRTLKLVHKASEGNIRKFLLLCRDVLSFSISLNSPKIDEKTVKKYIGS